MNTRNYNYKYYSKTATFTKIPWTIEQDNLVLAHKYSDRELSQMIGHSMMAIQIRRSRLKSEVE